MKAGEAGSMLRMLAKVVFVACVCGGDTVADLSILLSALLVEEGGRAVEEEVDAKCATSPASIFDMSAL